jgi:hypothetical protein
MQVLFQQSLILPADTFQANLSGGLDLQTFFSHLLVANLADTERVILNSLQRLFDLRQEGLDFTRLVLAEIRGIL